LFAGSERADHRAEPFKACWLPPNSTAWNLLRWLTVTFLVPLFDIL
jgi:hypothetical protein